MTRRRWMPIVLGGVGAVTLALPFIVSDFNVGLATEMLILALLALSLNLLLGHGGMLALGHAAFYGVGAYTTGILLVKAAWPFAIAMIAAPIVAAATGAIVGYFCVRLHGFYFSMLTLAFGQLVWGVIFKWSALTGGDDGLVGIAAPAMLAAPRPMYYFILVTVAVATYGLWRFVHSPFGYTVTAVRENAERMQFSGVNVIRVRLVTFIVAAGFAGIAGSLFAVFRGSVFTSYAHWGKSGEVVAMALLGGIYSFWGPAVGAAVMLVLDHTINTYTEYWPFFLGVSLLLLVLFIPGGLASIGARLARGLHHDEGKTATWARSSK